VIAASLLLILVAVALLVGGVVGSANILIVCSIVATVIAAIVLVAGVRQSAALLADADGLETDDGELPVEGGRDVPSPAPTWGRRAPDAGTATTAPLDDTPAATTGTGQAIPSQVFGDDDPRWMRPDSPGLFDRIDEPEPAGAADTDGEEPEDEPPDEPTPQIVPPAVAARVARLDTEVQVVDGRPRYHVPGCVHLLGRDSEPIPVNEAIDLGFTPCGLCEPDNVLLAEARRG
jgi:hypothetical protein